jgi:hypothetical protein
VYPCLSIPYVLLNVEWIVDSLDTSIRIPRCTAEFRNPIMNLHDCGVVYTPLPATVRTLRTKASILYALDIYRTGSVVSLSHGPTRTPYQQRKLRDIAYELVRANVIAETERGLELLPIDMEKNRQLALDRITIPAKADFVRLSVSALKVLLTLHWLHRYSRSPFQMELTQQQLARHAGITERRITDAIAQLIKCRLLKTSKQWKKPSKFTLLEPESGVELYYLGDFYRRRLQGMPVHDRYKNILSEFDPRDKLKDIRLGVSGYTVHCPLCTRKGSKPTLRFSSLEDDDRWKCFKCGRSGDSARLFARCERWVHRTSWRSMMAMVLPDTPSADAIEELAGEEFPDIGDLDSLASLAHVAISPAGEEIIP